MTVDLAALPPTPVDAEPVIVPGLLTGLGITRHDVPAWITDPATRESIETGLMPIDDLTGDTA